MTIYHIVSKEPVTTTDRYGNKFIGHEWLAGTDSADLFALREAQKAGELTVTAYSSLANAPKIPDMVQTGPKTWMDPRIACEDAR